MKQLKSNEKVKVMTSVGWFTSHYSLSFPDSFMSHSNYPNNKTHMSPLQKTETRAARQRITLAPIGGTAASESQQENFFIFSDRIMVESDLSWLSVAWY